MKKRTQKSVFFNTVQNGDIGDIGAKISHYERAIPDLQLLVLFLFFDSFDTLRKHIVSSLCLKVL